MSDTVIIVAMTLGTIILLATFFGSRAFKDNERSKDGSYGLSQAENKAKADIIANDTILRLNASQEKPGYQNVHVQVERDHE